MSGIFGGAVYEAASVPTDTAGAVRAAVDAAGAATGFAVAAGAGAAALGFAIGRATDAFCVRGSSFSPGF